jgi:F0F1-type ATP synthase assembly protein I
VKKTENRNSSSQPKNLLAYLDLGFRFAFSILLCTFGGYWLDSRLSTLPLFLILGALIGSTGGFLTVYRAVFPSKKHNDQNVND